MTARLAVAVRATARTVTPAATPAVTLPVMLATALMIALLASPFLRVAHAGPAPIGRYVPNAAPVGEARLKVLLWNVFDARLDAPAGRYVADAPFALSLSYLRSLDGDRIVDASIEEMTAQAAGRNTLDAVTLARWRDALERIVPDVEAGMTITGVRDALGHTRFYLDGEPIGYVEEPAFSRAFFDIWLGDRSSRPALRDRLLSSTTL